MPIAECWETEWALREERIAAGLQTNGPPGPPTTYYRLPDDRVRVVEVNLFGRVVRDEILGEKVPE